MTRDEADDTVAWADAATVRAAAAWRARDLPEARRLTAAALAIYDRRGEPAKAAATVARQAQIVRAELGVALALPFMRDALTRTQPTADLRTTASIQRQLGEMLDEAGHTDEALALVRDGYVPTAEQLGDPTVLAFARTDLARLLTKRGNPRAALALLPGCRATFKADGDLAAEAFALRSIAEAHLALHDHVAVRAVLLDDLVPLVIRIDDPGYTNLAMMWTAGLLAELAGRDHDISALIDEIRRRLTAT